MVTKLDTLSGEFFSFLFPLDFVPRGESDLRLAGSKLPGTFGMDVTVSGSRAIEDIHSSYQFEVNEVSEDRKIYRLVLTEAAELEAKDF